MDSATERIVVLLLGCANVEETNKVLVLFNRVVVIRLATATLFFAIEPYLLSFFGCSCCCAGDDVARDAMCYREARSSSSSVFFGGLAKKEAYMLLKCIQ